MRLYSGYIGLIGRLPIPLVSPESLKAGSLYLLRMYIPHIRKWFGEQGGLDPGVPSP